MNARYARRIADDLKSLDSLARQDGAFGWRLSRSGIELRYEKTPGLVLTKNQGIVLATRWTARLLLGPRYPVASHPVWIVCDCGVPFHPNVLQTAPHRVCYGRHLPFLPLSELALRLQRMITLHPATIQTDERDSLNPRACGIVRRLVREGTVPLRLDTPLPPWCRGSARGEEVRS
ncbi:MAG: hypothetical protein IMZ55_03875 [Acidobacteria bacterium]|nr:hypothetical protein [Planctomycetota bacterium]MBE3132586.1 hypothetical protein [Acidobacteriota bacterium]